jgi:PAS domain S-box-containing protein
MSVGESPLFEAGPAADALLHAGDFLDAGVLAVDAGLCVRGWNRWLEAATGRSAAEVAGRPLAELFPGPAGARAQAAFRRALDGETVVLAQRFHQFLLPLAPGPAFPGFEWMQQSARIVPLVAEGRVDGAVAVVQDVTERVAREAELRAAIERAEGASQAKSEFMAGLSHDLRTPLGAILGYADLLEGEIGGALTEPQKEHVRRVKAGVHHLTGIIEDILTFSRVEAGREPIHPERVDAAAIAADAVSLIEPQAGGKGLPVRLAVPDAPAETITDAGKLRQILVNLLGNAVRFTDAGAVELRVWVEPAAIWFSVRDTGPGIPSDYLERIFEPFTQVSSSTVAGRSGTGLGLPVSRRLARLLRGDLTVESTLGEGSVFTLSIPRVQAAEPERTDP